MSWEKRALAGMGEKNNSKKIKRINNYSKINTPALRNQVPWRQSLI